MDLKLTDQNLRTYNNFQYKLNTYCTPPPLSASFLSPDRYTPPPLCTPYWLHFYHDLSPEMVATISPAHIFFPNPRLFIASPHPDASTLHTPTKSGTTSLMITEEIPLPNISLHVRIRFGIYIVQHVYARIPASQTSWYDWANSWLEGKPEPAPVHLDFPCKSSPAERMMLVIYDAARYELYHTALPSIIIEAINARPSLTLLLTKAIQDEADISRD